MYTSVLLCVLSAAPCQSSAHQSVYDEAPINNDRCILLFIICFKTSSDDPLNPQIHIECHMLLLFVKQRQHHIMAPNILVHGCQVVCQHKGGHIIISINFLAHLQNLPKQRQCLYMVSFVHQKDLCILIRGAETLQILLGWEIVQHDGFLPGLGLMEPPKYFSKKDKSNGILV